MPGAENSPANVLAALTPRLAQPPPAAAPNWDQLEITPLCLRCGYNLRMLPQPRCPECGLEFVWAEVIEAAREPLDCPLFEYNWRRRPVRSFFGTLGRAFVPWRLWRNLRLAAIPRVGPLLLLIVLVPLLFGAAIILTRAVSYSLNMLGLGAFSLMPWRQIVFTWLQEVQGTAVELSLPAGGVLLVGVLLWLFVQIFRQTMARGRVRQSHVLRVVVLAWLPLAVWTLLRISGMVACCQVHSDCSRFERSNWWVLPELAIFALAQLSLCLGLGRYLKLRRGRLIGLVAGGTLTLLVFTVALATSVYKYGHFTNAVTGVIELLWPGLTRLCTRIVLHALAYSI
ncbi:MAG: hypothetical protein AB1716_08955 [Planctomycetota bacterium]